MEHDTKHGGGYGVIKLQLSFVFCSLSKKKVKKSNNIERSKNTRQSSPCNPLLLLFFGFQFKHGGLQKGATVQTPNPSCYLYGTLMAFPSRTMIPITCNNVN